VRRRSAWRAGPVAGLGVLIWVSTAQVRAGKNDSAEIKQLSSQYATALLNRDIKFLSYVIAPEEEKVGTDGRLFESATSVANDLRALSVVLALAKLLIVLPVLLKHLRPGLICQSAQHSY
jgi:hypothetical protein